LSYLAVCKTSKENHALDNTSKGHQFVIVLPVSMLVYMVMLQHESVLGEERTNR
jgi:hypothetical protein